MTKSPVNQLKKFVTSWKNFVLDLSCGGKKSRESAKKVCKSAKKSS